MRGPQNGDSTRDTFRGSNLNLGWSKRGDWWVNQGVPISWLHIESSRYYWMHAWVFVFTWGIDIIDYDDCLSWLRILIVAIFFFSWFIAIFVWDTDMLVALIDYLTLFSIVTLILSCLFWSLHMYRLAIVYHLIWHDYFSRLYIILIFMEHAIIATYSSRLACV